MIELIAHGVIHAAHNVHHHVHHHLKRGNISMIEVVAVAVLLMYLIWRYRHAQLAAVHHVEQIVADSTILSADYHKEIRKDIAATAGATPNEATPVIESIWDVMRHIVAWNEPHSAHNPHN
jgi:galactose-1-phosphate uridylyltransferase